MSGEGRIAEIVEVFPMRLGSEVLVDLTLEMEGGGEPAPPHPEDPVTLLAGTRRIPLVVWSVPGVPRVPGTRRFNVQFRRADLGDLLPEPGMKLLLS